MTALKTYTLEDLNGWDKSKVSLAVLGHPVQHSLSPDMHNAALAALLEDYPAIEGWSYHKFDIPPEQLKDALPKFHAAGFKGLNLTLPHKVEAVDYVDGVDPEAIPLGAVNALLANDHGYYAYNTDGFGLVKSVSESFKTLGLTPFLGRKVVLLGAGGAARSAALEAVRMECETLYIGNRDQKRRAALLEKLNSVRAHGFDINNPPAEIFDAAIIINATSLGMKRDDPSPLLLDSFDSTVCVYDMIYNPAETKLLKCAAERGMPFANGLGMLVWQGARSLAIWSGLLPIGGQKIESIMAPVMRSAAEKSLDSMS